MNQFIRVLILVGFCGISFDWDLAAAVKPTEEQSQPLPEIWQNVSAQERLKAVRAAEVDASRLLLEKIRSLSVNSQTNVTDLMMVSDSIRGEISASIRGVTTSEPAEFLPDGRVQVVRRVKVQQVYEVITRVTQNLKRQDGSYVKLFDTRNVSESKRDAMLEAMGNSALAHSDGMKKIRAKRAAEVDAYRKLAERVLGISITSDSTVRDLALKSDKVKTALAAQLKGADTIGIKYKSDFTCEVTMQIKEADIIRTVRRTVGGKDQGLPKDWIESKVFSETGVGAPRSDENDKTEEPMGFEPADESSDISETKEVIEKLLHQEPVPH